MIADLCSVSLLINLGIYVDPIKLPLPLKMHLGDNEMGWLKKKKSGVFIGSTTKINYSAVGDLEIDTQAGN